MRWTFVLLVLLCPLIASKTYKARDRPLEYYRFISRDDQWDEEKEVYQPVPKRIEFKQFVNHFFDWSTNKEQMVELNEGIMNLSFSPNNEDLTIVCKYDKTPALLRLVPAESIDNCSFDGGIAALCPDLINCPTIQLDRFVSGKHFLTSFSDGTTEGINNTAGGFCSKGIKIPIELTGEPRDYSHCKEERPRPTTPKYKSQFSDPKCRDWGICTKFDEDYDYGEESAPGFPTAKPTQIPTTTEPVHSPSSAPSEATEVPPVNKGFIDQKGNHREGVVLTAGVVSVPLVVLIIIILYFQH